MVGGQWVGDRWDSVTGVDYRTQFAGNVKIHSNLISAEAAAGPSCPRGSEYSFYQRMNIRIYS